MAHIVKISFLVRILRAMDSLTQNSHPNDGLIQARALNTWSKAIAPFIQAMVFTHNNLAPRNILVRDGHVVGIVDWEFSGFYSQYWEYVSALFWPDWQSSWIKEKVVGRILQPYLLELAYIW